MRDIMEKVDAVEEVVKEKKGRVVLNWIVNIVLILALVCGAYFSYAAFMTSKGGDIPSVLGYKPFSIQSDSMSPTFESGDLVISKEVSDYSELEVGDIITFWTIINGEQVLNTHRITEVMENDGYYYFTTQGDNNTSEDAMSVYYTEIEGQYVTHISGFGSVVDFLQTSTGFLIFIVLPVFLFFIYHLVTFFRVLFAYQAEKMKIQMQAESEAGKTAAAAAEADRLAAIRAEAEKILAQREAEAAKATEEVEEKTEEAEEKAEEVEEKTEEVEATEDEIK